MEKEQSQRNEEIPEVWKAKRECCEDLVKDHLGKGCKQDKRNEGPCE